MNSEGYFDINPQAYNQQPGTTKMSEQAPAPSSENKDANSTEEKPAENTATTETDAAAQKQTPMKKVKSKKELKNDPTRFEMPGVNFNAKLIGTDDVANARGDKMCQESMHKLKIAMKTSGQHKQKIVINVSLDGIRIIDLRTQTTHHSHPVHRISFISRDLTDGRAFGYVFGAGEGKHKFFAIKTEKAAEALVLTLRDLFQVVYDLKKKEVEEAKTKAEEKTEEGAEATEEPVYQVPNKAVPVENGSGPAGGTDDPTYQVPPNNAPVKDTSNDLLMLETEMEAIEKRIEEINTMDELFKELESPPVTTAAPSSSGSSWSSDLAGLSSPPQPTFSVGGSPFAGGQPFGQQQPGFPPQNPQQGFMNQPFGAPQHPGNPMMTGAPFGNQQAAPNPFGAPPSIPARPGVGFQGQLQQPPAGFPGQQPPAGGFPGTPFPGVQQLAFPPVPNRGGPSPQPVINVQPPTDPFGNDPFVTDPNAGFDEGILTPARLESELDKQPEQPKKKDAFDDLVNIGVKTAPTKSPKDLFSELSAPAKTSLNEMKSGNRTPSPNPSSPVNQASPEDRSSPISNVSWTSNPFSNEDPFANDPFASNTNMHIASSFDNVQTAQPSTPAHPPTKGSRSKDSVFDDDFNLPSPEGPPPPLPQGPPPPLPTNIIHQSTTIDSYIRPEPPPRPTVNNHLTPPPPPPRPGSTHSDSPKNRRNNVNHESRTLNQQQTPPLPARPTGSQSAKSKINSVSEPRPQSQPQTPPLPPRPRTVLNAIAVPRPRPRSASNKDVSEVKKSELVNHESQKYNERVDFNSNTQTTKRDIDHKTDLRINTDLPKNSWKPSFSSPKIADPFVSTDPFATEDPFMQSDPFTSDPFATDPFSDPAFTSNTQSSNSNDPFTSVVASPQPSVEEKDPFSVFDKTFSSDGFKFDRSSVKKVKLKGTANFS